MKKNYLLLIYLLLLTAFACNNATDTTKKTSDKATENLSPEFREEETLAKNILAVHDKIMPWDAELNRQLRAVKKSLKKADLQDDTKQSLLKKQKFLEDTHDAMMDWMAAYASPKKLRTTKSHEEIMTILKKSQEDVLKLKKSYDIIIKDAEK